MPTTPEIILSPCSSAAMTGYGYDIETSTLAIQFTGGSAPSLFAAVPPEVFQGLVDAESKGNFYAESIRGQFLPPEEPAAGEGA